MGYQTNNKIYKQALTHKSANKHQNNERLELLGDAVLSLIITELLFLENPTKGEGFLSKKRATIVARKHLNMVGEKIILAKQINHNLIPVSKNIFGNTLEAIIGAIYIDKGFFKTKEFIVKHIYKSTFLKHLIETDFKTQLLNYSQKRDLKLEYILQKQTGLDHKKNFLVAVFMNNKKMAEGGGRSKKEAEQNAAKKVINSVF